MTAIDDRLHELLAKEAIRDCLYRYCRGVDRRDYDMLRSAYHPDAVDDHGPAQGTVEDLIEFIDRRHDHIQQSMHMLGGSLIRVDGDSAVAETQCLTFQYFTPEASESIALFAADGGASVAGAGSALRVTNLCRYVDRFEDRGDGWRIASRVVVVESVRTEPTTEPLHIPAGWAESTRNPADPSYEFFR